MDPKKKALKKAYLGTPRRMGVYQIRNIVNEKVLVGGTLNLDAIFNRHRFQLRMGKHPNVRLQAEWNQFGEATFVFEVLDELASREEMGNDYRDDVALLEEIWVDKLTPYGEHGYNERKKDRQELLSSMAERRSRES